MSKNHQLRSHAKLLSSVQAKPAFNTPSVCDVVVRSLDELKPNPKNARTHSKRQIRQIADSIRTFGFLNPILIDDRGMVLAGNGRFAAARLLGLESVPTLRASGLSAAQKRAYVLADNKLAEKAGWDREILAIELVELARIIADRSPRPFSNGL